MKKACIFDLDGTLLYTLTSIAVSGNEALRHFGYPDEPEAAYAYYCGNGSDILVERILKKNNDTDPEHFQIGCAIVRETIREKASLGVKPYEGIVDTLKELKSRGIKLAVCSNKPDEAAQVAVREQFGDLFDFICGQKAPRRLKPAPDAPLYVAENLGVKPEACLYIGDTDVDMQTGKAAGMTTLGVTWGYRTRLELTENKADYIIDIPHEILNFVAPDRNV